MTALKSKFAKLMSSNLAIGTAALVAVVASAVGLTVDLDPAAPDPMASGWHLRGTLPMSDAPLRDIPRAAEAPAGSHFA